MESQRIPKVVANDAEAEAIPAEQASSEEMPQIPDLPQSTQFDSFDDLYDFLQSFHRDNGAALTKDRTRKKAGVMTSCVFVCDRGSRRPSASAGLRNTTTQKIDCPFKIVASTSKRAQWKWTYHVKVGQHNHGPSVDPSAHNIHRRRTPAQREVAKQVYRDRNVRPRELMKIVKDVEKRPSYFRDRDIYNDRVRIKLDALRGKTPTHRETVTATQQSQPEESIVSTQGSSAGVRRSLRRGRGTHSRWGDALE
ncbi:uncharacterized protein CPUR_02738 [Claviceps purpurea 20.1]|uniref:FAR1 domain-containing protein n=1 Tax=Claviceps purpurea (strain 20.1) TaxID=1111077 RepID=M1VV78_CLAP2|nr:uncharacterized protein CPUR_02738 [Claviceps purpurea 20.1]